MSEVKLSKKAEGVTPGKYEHYKKRKYQVLGVVIHSETLDELVLYKALYGDRLTWVRPLDMFLENVEVDGETRLRFKLIKAAK